MVDALLSACNVKQRPPAVTTAEGEPTDTTLVIMEEPDSPSVLLLTQSRSARCSQTDKVTPEARTQWAADVRYPVTADHI